MTAPEIGAVVRDVGRDRVGEVMAVVGGRVLLRAPGGGREWEALPGDPRPAATGDALRARVADVNERSRRERDRREAAPTRCRVCWEIKQGRYRAVEDDDRDEAARLATAMGRHQREAHP
ncbi:hypothetical protein [Streptomyces sp. UNOB3_S3]|uniref:hypothetical protein n=1 Tax=Streptomyces sp. UNOB3_S3 TaxID=2871682 RepID=UPI001E3EC7FE|nr:hypothetical protein [Streptomyces sp. UNOB3_S3]MCC3779726.1 hypothetical protein [Streptomyces sp. UNOB3_S3]